MIKKVLSLGVIVCTLLMLQACTSKEVVNPPLVEEISFDDYDEEVEVSDPLEGYNRVMHSFNDFVLLNIIKPVHKGYSYVVPKKVRSGLSNFSDNLMTPIRMINAVLQLDFAGASVEFGHFIVNTVTSLGLADVASTEESLVYYNPNAYDFGVTLARWGVPSGPSFVLPFFGPRNIRDTFGFVGDIAMDPVGYVLPIESTIANAGLNFNNLDQIYMPYEALTESAIDPYIAVRDATENRRKGLIEEHLSHFK